MTKAARPMTAKPRGARHALRIRPNPRATPAEAMQRYRRNFPGLIEAMGRAE